MMLGHSIVKCQSVVVDDYSFPIAKVKLHGDICKSRD